MTTDSPGLRSRTKRLHLNQSNYKKYFGGQETKDIEGFGRLDKSDKSFKKPYELDSKFHMEAPPGLDPILKQLELQLKDTSIKLKQRLENMRQILEYIAENDKMTEFQSQPEML